MNVEGKAGKEIRTKSRGIIGKGKGLVKMAAELVVVGGDARWSIGIEKSAANLG